MLVPTFQTIRCMLFENEFSIIWLDRAIHLGDLDHREPFDAIMAANQWADWSSASSPTTTITTSMERLNISILVGRTPVRFRVKPTMQAMRMHVHLLEHLGLGGQTDMIRILHDGIRMRDDTLSAQGVQDGDELDCMFDAVGSVHSGLHLVSPTDIPQLTIKLVLTPGIVLDSTWLPGFHSYDDHGFIDWAGSLLTDTNDWQWGRRSGSLLQERETGERGEFLQWLIRFVRLFDCYMILDALKRCPGSKMI